MPVAEKVIAASGVEFRIWGGERLLRSVVRFCSGAAAVGLFKQINYYCACLHELTHATGHADRLGRDRSNSFGTKGYAREELVTEMGSAFLCAALGIVPTLQHADYIGSWRNVARGQSRDLPRRTWNSSDAFLMHGATS